MHIYVNEGKEKNVHLHLPGGLLLNRLSANLLSAKLTEQSINISGKQLHILFRAIKAFKAAHPQWKLVEVQSHDGKTVGIVV